MTPISIKVGLTFDDESLNALTKLVSYLLEHAKIEPTARSSGFPTTSRPMTPRERSQHALFAGQKPPEDRGLLIDTREACRLLKVSSRTLWRMYTSGEMPPPIRIGRAVRWGYDELQDWVRTGCPPDKRHRT